MKKIAVLVKDVDQQYEALRTSLGALLEMAEVSMFVLDHEIGTMDEAYAENMEFLDEMEGLRYSNNQVNVDTYGFQPVTLAEVGKAIKASDIVIPF